MTLRHPLATSTWDDAERAAIMRVVASDQYSMGPEVRQFEDDFAQYFGARHAVMVNSGSSANLLMVAALFYTSDSARRLKRGDEVIVPAVSWSTTYYPLYQYGLKLVFVDIDLGTLNMDLDALAEAITDRTRLIFAVNLLGNINDFTKMKAIVGDRPIDIIEDNCESMGATLGGQMAGTFGVMGSFSTFFSHHISTMEGGVIVTDDEELYHILLSLRAHGWTRNLPAVNRVTGTKSYDPFEEAFRFVLPGYNVRPLEMSGAIGQEQLKKLPDLLANRRANGALFVDILSDNDKVMIQRTIGVSSWFGFSLICRPGTGFDRTALRSLLAAEGYEVRPIVTGNFARNPVVKYFDHVVHDSLTNANYLDANGIFIGNHHYSMADSIKHLGIILNTF